MLALSESAVNSIRLEQPPYLCGIARHITATAAAQPAAAAGTGDMPVGGRGRGALVRTAGAVDGLEKSHSLHDGA